MSMTYRDATGWLLSLTKLGIKLGLHNTRALLRLMGDPHKGLRVVHLAGTNGKGSTAAMLTSICTQAGLTCGLTTSPHILDLTERIRIGAADIPKARFAELTERLKTRVEAYNAAHRGHPLLPTFFEATIVLAFAYFADEGVDLAVVETGLGGRLDATNVVTPDLVIIPSIGLEHTDMLGDTLAKISREKAAIIKRSAAAVLTGVDQPEALGPIFKRAEKLGVPVECIGHEIRIRPHEKQVAIRTPRGSMRVVPPLAGNHQHINTALAVRAAQLLAVRGFAISDRAIRSGLAATRWPGRLELIDGTPPWLIDCAHNPPAVETLIDWLGANAKDARVLCIFAAMKDKDYPQMLARLAPFVSGWIFTRPQLERAQQPQRLAAALPDGQAVYRRARVKDAVSLARSLAGDYEMILVAGSIFLVAEAYEAVKRAARP